MEVFENLEGFGLGKEGKGRVGGVGREGCVEKNRIGEGGKEIPTFFEGKTIGIDEGSFFSNLGGFF